ncbi:conserved unknown protein [Ectocarpus siliculosus]|uniref:Anamorsin homolog n=1 Tax=Ectocarpus siliculosus TaxID=2880 RepID=D7FUN0_ECTSI|nr:conserved unknown protein [Ectocarpus siliculosus]|eukprot:CBJ31697.1 conserved unknown protein [Ectocarpus siliculosus]
MEVDEPPLSFAPAPAGSKALVVCRRDSEEASSAQQWASRSRSDGTSVSVCPPGHLESHARANAGAYDTIVVEEAGEGAVLGQVVKLLKAGGNINVAASSQGGEAAAAALKRALTFAGFLNVAANPEDPRVLSGERAAWETGASAPVRLSFGASKNDSRNGTNGNGPAAAATAAAANKTWKLALDDDEDGAGGGEDDDLIDEDALLESSAPVKRASETAGDGCATKRRACKDCSCGRAEMEMSGGVSNTNGGAAGPLPVVSVGDVDDALTSACGNCSKGDAFRCGGCPFLGKPAFEKGQEKTIMLLDLDSQQDD